MSALNLKAATLCLAHGAVNHLVRNGIGEKYQQVGRAYLLLQTCGHLGKNLCLTAVTAAGVDIKPLHAVVSADNDNTHSINTSL